MLLRNIDIIIVFFFISIAAYFIFPLSPSSMSSSELELFNRAVDSILSFASLATAFLFFTVSFIPVMAEKSPLFKSLKTDVKMLERIMLDSFLFFLTSIMSLIFIITDLYTVLHWTIIYTVWLGLILTSIYGMLDIFLQLFRNINKEIKK